MHLDAQGAQLVELLLASAVAHHDLQAVALLDGHQRQPHGGVARGVLDDEVAGLEAAVPLGLLDHVLGDAVLDAARGVDELELGEHLGRAVGEDLVSRTSGVLPMQSSTDSSPLVSALNTS